MTTNGLNECEITFAKDGVLFVAKLSEADATRLRDQLLKKYPVKTGRDMCGTESTANDEMVLRAAKALMESQTNFAHPPTRQDVDAVWDGLGDMTRDGFLAQARHILERLGEERS